MKKWLIRIAMLLGAISLLAFGVVYFGFRASLPELEGSIITTSVSAPVSLERDENGGATITAATRRDLSYVTGFVHAQERFFQMDLGRRLAAGELSELFGALAINADKRNRIHRFRSRSQAAVSMLGEADRELLSAYAKGVNDGLAALGAKPFEYWLLGSEPESWKAEDSFLAVYSMFFTLQPSDGSQEWNLHLMRSSLPEDLADFLLPDRTPWDAPLQLDEGDYVELAIPAAPPAQHVLNSDYQRDDSPMLGSNNWAVTGELTSTGAGMVSNDMHLSIRSPSIWYKLRMKLSDGSLDINGVTLPGVPAIVVGSNGSVAWGFTNSNVDTSDIIELSINPENENQYLTADGYKEFEVIEEQITAADGAAETITIRETIWGPVMDMGNGKPYAYRWTAHLPGSVNLELLKMEQVTTVHDALAIAGDVGIPTQNAMLVDSEGNAAWALFGRLAKRPDDDSNKVQDWSDGAAEWHDWYGALESPKVLNPDNNRLWTANSRVVSGEDLAKVGVGRYDLGARSQQIKERLAALTAPVSENDLYQIMLDDEAIFLSRWQTHLAGMLFVAENEAFKPFLEQIENWGGRADKNSIGYRLVREYRNQVVDTMLAHLSATCVAYDENCDYDRATRQWEAPVWQLMTERPAGWLPNGETDWQFFFEQQAYEAWRPLLLGETSLEDHTWGARNTTDIIHPLSQAIPVLGKLTDMPSAWQSGDSENIPYITGRAYGQSERMVVSPGYEERGILDLPAGQSAHPLSPYFGAGHDDWLNGGRTPFLPGEAKWTLEFAPN